MKKYMYLFLFVPFILFAQEYNRNILVEVMTNSHCVLCPAAHAAVDSYLSSSPNAGRVKLIYYHMNFPYPDDQLNIANTSDASARNSYYGPFSGMPQTFFDGQAASTNYSQWNLLINSRLSIKTPVEIKLSGTKNANTLNLSADLTIAQNFSTGDLTIQFILVENVNYQGRNGINFHKNVMRAIAGTPNGKAISAVSQKVIASIQASTSFAKENLGVVVFIQRTSTKEVLQSEFISYADLTVTDVNEKQLTIPSSFILRQNFPNPFNPSTIINYELPIEANVSLRVYDILGNLVAILADGYKSADSHNVTFSGDGLTSGVYFYELNAGTVSRYNKMLLLK